MCIYTCIMQIRAENQNLVSALKEQPKKKAEKKPSKKVDEKSNRQPKKSLKVKDEVPVKEPRKNKTPENIDQIDLL